MNKTKRTSRKKQQQKKILVTTIAVGATGILGYFGWQYLKKRRGSATSDIDTLIKNLDQPIVDQVNPPMVKTKSKSKITSYSPEATSKADGFPLKKGSKGENVRRLQEALIANYGKTVLPKFGADGDFGSEVANALKKLGLPTNITESTLNVIAQSTSANGESLGKDLYNAAVSKNFTKTLTLLQSMKSVDDYSKANEQFKVGRINGVRQTIVNGLLASFPSEAQKQKIKFEFLRIGLQFDGSKWSLSGFDGLSIVTLVPTSVWVNATQSVKVPARMVLGNEVSKRLDYTLFENGGKHFLVQTKTVKYL